MRPCFERFSRESSARSTTTLVESIFSETPVGMARDSSPLGPLTPTIPALGVMVTPFGSGSGFLPILDMVYQVPFTRLRLTRLRLTRLAYQTSQRSSPPTPALRAAR